MNYAKLGSQIRAARKARKWTQGALAKQAGRSVSYIGHVERGTRKASMKTLSILCDALEISLGDALGRINSDQLTKIVMDVAELKTALEMAQKIAARIQSSLSD